VVKEDQALRESWQETQRRLLQWGLEEIEYRKRDLINSTPVGLEQAKLKAAMRRKAAGLNADEASRWMREARKALKQGKVEIVKAGCAHPTDIPTTQGEAW
jgi:hypothetical protein